MGKVTVFGSFIVDLAFRGDRLPIPGETVFGEFAMGPGGKGSNQAVAAKLAGADVNFITMIGEDIFADVAVKFYQKIGMDTKYVYRTKESHTGVASIAVETRHGQNQIMVARGVSDKITDEVLEKSLDAFLNAEVFLTQFECNFNTTAIAIILAKLSGAQTILNPAPAMEFDHKILSYVDVIIPNETEASLITGICVLEENFHKKAAEKLSKSVKTVIITLGSKGVYCPSVSENILPAFNVKAVDTTGAGDAFCGALATALAEHQSLQAAITFAQAGAGISVTRHGTAPAMPTRKEIEEFIKSSA
jgi:ribokinase